MTAYQERRNVIKIFLSKQHPQSHLLGPMDFCSYASDRGIHIDEWQLEEWDRLGVFHPLLKVRVAHTDHLITEHHPDGSFTYDPNPIARVADESDEIYRLYETLFFGPEVIRKWRDNQKDVVICPARSNYQPRSERRDGWIETISVFYHRFQIFRVIDVVNACSERFSFPDFNLRQSNWELWRRDIKRRLQSEFERLRNSENGYLQELKLLIALEDRYSGELTGRVSSLGLPRANRQTWYEWASSYEPNVVFDTCGLSIDSIQEMRAQMVHRGSTIDPNRDWYMLIRHAAHDWREKLKQKALLAWDYYLVAEMLGAFLHHVTGDQQPHTGDVLGFGAGDWKQHIYGVPAQEVDYQKQNVLPVILRQYGLDPGIKVLFIVEGQTEVEFINTWFHQNSIALSAFGIKLLCLKGISELRNSGLKHYIKDAHRANTSVVMAVDDELDASKQLAMWVQNGIIDRVFDTSELGPEKILTGAVLWRPCFEDANFTSEEILDSWLEVVSNKLPGIEVDSNVIKNAVYEQKRLRPDQSWIKAVEEIANTRLFRPIYNFKLPFSKPEIGAELARRIKDSETRPIVSLLWNVISVAKMSRSFFISPRYKARSTMATDYLSEL